MELALNLAEELQVDLEWENGDIVLLDVGGILAPGGSVRSTVAVANVT